MVNFSLNAGSFMGILLAIAGAGLYFIRTIRPNLARDYDVFFAAVALLCGFIFVFQGWRLDPILQFGVLLLSSSTIFFAIDSIRLRNIATEQAKRRTPIVDEDRPVSRKYEYQAELDDEGYDYFEERQPPARRIRGSRDSRSSSYGEDQEERRPRRSNRALGRSEQAYDSEERGNRSRRSRSTNRSNHSFDTDNFDTGSYDTGSQWNEGDQGWGSSDRPWDSDEIDENISTRTRSKNRGWEVQDRQMDSPADGFSDYSQRYAGDYSGEPSSDRGNPSDSALNPSQSEGSSRRPGRRRPPASVMSRATSYRSSGGDDSGVDSSLYVDYRPLDSDGDEFDNSNNFDD
jgi:hypothetical protein